MTIAEKLTLIAENQQKVYDAGYEKGKSEGGDTDAAYEQGYENGLNDGNSLYYAKNIDGVFNYVTFPENFEFIVKVKSINDIDSAFSSAKNLKSIKLISEDKETLISAQSTFRDCKQLETIDITEFSNKFNYIYYFIQDSTVKNILGALDVSRCKSFPNTTFQAETLEHIEFVPNTIYKSIRVSSAKLNEISKESIINGLADLTNSETQTITLDGVGASLTEEQKARIAAKNWTLAY